MSKNEILPSILSSNFIDLYSQLNLLENEKIKTLHIDVMDGHFVKNLTFGVPIIKSIRENFPKFYLETHLMVENPENFLSLFIPFSDIIIFHYEATSLQKDIIKTLKSSNKKIGISIKPGTNLTKIIPFIDYIDIVLVMTVEPGFPGQKYIKKMEDKILNLKNYVLEKNLNIDISVDGGIDKETILFAKQKGANRFVIGSKLFNNNIDIMKSNLKDFKQILDME